MYSPDPVSYTHLLPYNTPIDYDVMKQIEVGEGYLRELLGGNVRLRLHGNVVRIEADKTSFGKLLEHGDEIEMCIRDRLMGITMISAAMVFAGNFIADILYEIIDPRMRRGAK